MTQDHQYGQENRKNYKIHKNHVSYIKRKNVIERRVCGPLFVLREAHCRCVV